MKYFIDTEFVEPTEALISPPILLISLAIVGEDGREYYAQDDYMRSLSFSEYPWLQEHVIPYLTENAWKDRATIRREVEAFINAGDGAPEFIFWCGCYDYVILCQLFGGMLNLPAGWPHSIIDIQEVLNKHKITDDMLPPQTDQAHNALADARHLKLLWEWLSTNTSSLKLLWEWLFPSAVRWQVPGIDPGRLLHGAWLPDVKPLILVDGKPLKGVSNLTMHTEGTPPPENNRDFVGTWHGGELIPKGDPRLDEKGDPIEELIGGYVGHDVLATTGGDNGQADELVIDLSEEERQKP